MAHRYVYELDSYASVGLIADTHEMMVPASFGPAMADLDADLNVHLGDVASSPTIVKLVDEFKKAHGEVEMTVPQRSRFNDSIAQGRSPVRSYLESWDAVWPELEQIRVRETLENCRQVLRAWRSLHNSYIVAGNVDRHWLRHPAARELFQYGDSILVEHPVLLDRGDVKILLWPSMMPRRDDERLQLSRTVAKLGGELRTCEYLTVLAHEQLFRGPVPSRYLANLANAGMSHTTVPYYAPNPTRALLCRLLAGLQPHCQIYAFSGHIHDRQEVIAAGVGYLPKGPNGGLLLRLPAANGRVRRHIECFCLPAGVPGTLEIGPGGTVFSLVETSETMVGVNSEHGKQ